MTVVKKSRAYNSPARAAAAVDTRRRIVDAASACFTRSGYAATTLKAIATAAEVSVETVNGHGPKRALLFAAFEIAFVGREGADSAATSPDFAASLSAASVDEFLSGVIHASAHAFSRSGGIWRALNAAADVDPAVADTLADLLRRRRADFELTVSELEERGLVIAGDRRRAIDATILIVSHDSYRQLVDESGWSPDDWESWARRMVRVVLSGP